MKKLGRGSSQSAAEPVVHSVLDPLSAALEGTDPLSMMAAQAAAATQATDPLSQMAAATTVTSPLTDPLSRMSISKVKRSAITTRGGCGNLLFVKHENTIDPGAWVPSAPLDPPMNGAFILCNDSK